jgi:hypothetical protein
MKHKEGLIPLDLKFFDPWNYRGIKVQVDSPNQHNVMAEIREPYVPGGEDLDDSPGEIFWCNRLDGKPWKNTSQHDSLGNGDKWLAIHHVYLFKPPMKGEWDNEENNDG